MAMLRSVKNVVHNYTEAEVKVREATSNDNWGPSTTILQEISDLTQNQIAYSEVMAMLWKRLNDHGKNWRHVDKSLIVIDYLVRNGSDRVCNQCKENIFVIETLKNFQHIEKNGQDMGRSIRQKADNLVKLLKDEELLKEAKDKAKVTRQRLMESGHAVSSLNSYNPPPSTGSRSLYGHRSRPSNLARASDDMEAARPANANEEELQMQLAIQMSKAESSTKNSMQEKEDIKMEMALKQSLAEENERKTQEKESAEKAKANETNLLDINDPWALPQSAPVTQQQPAISQTQSAPMDPFNLGMPMPSGSALPNQSSQMNDPWGLGSSTAGAGVSSGMQGIGSPSPVMTQQPLGGTSSLGATDPWGNLQTAQTSQPNQPSASPLTINQSSAFSQPAAMSINQPTQSTGILPSQIDPWGSSQPEVPKNMSTQAVLPAINGSDPFGGALAEPKVTEKPRGKTPDLGKQFLGDIGADLVNLDTIVANPQKPAPTNNIRSVSPNVFTQAPGYSNTTNPFSSQVNQNTGSVFSSAVQPSNPFASTAVGPTLNQMMAEQNPATTTQNSLSNINFSSTTMFPNTNGPNLTNMQSNNGSTTVNSNANANPFF